MSNGKVVAWGSDWVGQTNVPAGVSNIVAIAAGEFHSLALKANGTVVAWGFDGDGKTLVPAGLSNVVAIAAGQNHSLALKADGTVVAWGQDVAGVLDVPPGLSNVTAISASYVQSLALKADGTVVAWGDVTNVPPGMSNVTAIAAGGTYNLALVSEGPPSILVNPQSQTAGYPYSVALSVSATGREPLSYGWFLDGTAVSDNARIHGSTNATLSISNMVLSDIGSYSVLVSNAFGCVLSSPAALTVTGSPFIAVQPTDQTVQAGSDVSFSVSAIGTSPLSYQWFCGGKMLAGTTNSQMLLTNVQSSNSGIYFVVVTNIYGDAFSTVAALTVTDSPPYIVNQPFSQSGYAGYSITLSVSARGSLPLSYQWRFDGADIPGATNATLSLTNLSLAQAGYYHVVISNPFGQAISAKALLTVETTDVVVWGNNAPTNLPPGLTNLVAVAGGYGQVLGLKADGTVEAWANPNYGYYTNIPPGATNVIAIAAGPNNMALRSDETVIAAGSFVTPFPTGLTNILAISEKYAYALALKSDNTVFAWGDNYYGQTNAPPGLSNIVAIAAGPFHALASKADGSVVAWGGNQMGQANAPNGLTNVIAVAGGTYHSLALKADGKVTVWGGYNPITNVPPSVSNVVAIAGGFNQSLALKADGSLIAWGADYTFSLPPGLTNVFAIAAGGAPGIPGFYAALIGTGSPHITLQPMSQTAPHNTPVYLHARAVGVQPMSYQWQWNGQNLSGATNDDLTVSNAPGAYRMIAANALGAVTSRVAQVGASIVPLNMNLGMALNATNLVWNTYSYNRNQAKGYGLWFAENQVTHDGIAAAQSGAITNSEQSILQTTVTGPGTLTFCWKVSSEEDFDFLEFFLDYTNMTPISGEVDWQQLSFSIPSGLHTLKWIYAKDPSVSVGQDAGWLDEVSFTPPAPAPQRLIAPAFLSDGSFSFIASNAADKFLQPSNVGSFEIQASTDLVNWVTLTNPLALTNGALQWRDAASTNYPTRFYRLMEH